MSTETILIVLSAIVLVSYLFDILSKHIRLPPVILLIIGGLSLRLISDWSGYAIPYLAHFLAPLGTIGLILIVLEAGLDLELNLEKRRTIGRSLLAAAAGLGLCLFLMAAIFKALFGAPWRICMVNALPFSVISSAIAIPAAALLAEERREFITYESSFSDILGILSFNFLVFTPVPGIATAFAFSFELLMTLLLSVVFSLALTALLERIGHKVKHLPVFAILLLVYAAAKRMHFSPLLLVLVFGLFLNNITLFIRGNMRLYFNLEKITEEVRLFKGIITETTFVIKTFFFILLGYSADIPRLLDSEIAVVILPLAMAAYASRALPLRLLLERRAAAALTYVAPRGLITILLFMGVPAGMRLTAIPDGVLLWSVLLTSLVMAWGIIKHPPGETAPEKANAAGEPPGGAMPA